MAKISTVIRGFKQLENKNIVVLNKDEKIVQIFQPQDDVFKTLENDKLFIYRIGATQFLSIFIGDGTKDFTFELFGQTAETLNLNTEELYLKLMTDFFFRNVGGEATPNNFANTNLTFDGNRQHDQNGFGLILNNSEGGQGQRLEITKEKFDAIVEDGTNENRLTITKNSFLIKNENGPFVTDIQTADEVGKVLTLDNATTKSAVYKYPTPKQSFESFNINIATDTKTNSAPNVFTAVRRTIPAGVYNTFEFFLDSIQGFQAGESCILRIGLYIASNNAIIAQISQSINLDITNPERYQIQLGQNLVFDEAVDIYFVFGTNDFLGSFNLRSPTAKYNGDSRTDQIFNFTQNSGPLPLNIGAVSRTIANRFFYTQLKGL